MKVMEPWVLLGVQGEPASDDPVEGPAREHPPEAVLAAYLAAYRYVGGWGRGGEGGEGDAHVGTGACMPPVHMYACPSF
jgi:hypothetical protein